MTKSVSEIVEKIVISVVAVTVVSVAAYIFYYESNYPYQCVETATITELVSALHRDVVVRLEDGSTITVNQPYPEISVGSEVCLNMARQRKE